MMRRALRVLVPASALLLATGSRPAPDDLDRFIAAQMDLRQVAGLSIAIIDGGRIVDARAYGVTDASERTPVDTTTLFQAGSVSKAVAAFGALRLVEQQTLRLDTDVNATLRTWRVPPSEFTGSTPVTLRRLLSHSAGLTVSGFGGYAVNEPVPTLVQVLNGAPPANSGPVRSEAVPGSRWRYSGGGYTVMQQMIVDATGERFPDVMRQHVLAPIGMQRSSFEQPVPASMAAKTAAGHYQDRSPVRGRWHVYPEMAAAGLWTTPSDLARFAIALQRAYTGQSATVMTPGMARQMFTTGPERDGLGVFVLDTGRALRFTHSGRNAGFDADFTATANTGQGMAIMINANDDSRMVARIRDFVAIRYHWPKSEAYVAPRSVSLPRARVDDVAGRYELANNQMIAFTSQHGRLFVSTSGLPDEEFVPVAADQFVSAERNVRFAVVRDASEAVTGLSWTDGTTTHPVPRLGPLFRAITAPGHDDPALDARVDATLRAIGAGGAALAAAPGVTAGVRRDYGAGGWPGALGLRSLQFVGAQPVAGRNVERHGSRVTRVLYYRMTTSRGTTLLLVHLSAEGLVTDVDEVDV